MIPGQPGNLLPGQLLSGKIEPAADIQPADGGGIGKGMEDPVVRNPGMPTVENGDSRTCVAVADFIACNGDILPH